MLQHCLNQILIQTLLNSSKLGEVRKLQKNSVKLSEAGSGYLRKETDSITEKCKVRQQV
jgi:hypothetical protein